MFGVFVELREEYKLKVKLSEVNNLVMNIDGMESLGRSLAYLVSFVVVAN